MSRNTKLYTYADKNAPKLYNNGKWGELIKVIRHCVNGGEWFENGITQIVYEKEKEFVRVYLDNSTTSFKPYQTIEFNENCDIFSNKEAIIRIVTRTHIDVTFHDEIPELTDSTTVNLENMNIRIAKLGFTEAYTDRDCGVFKTENHDFYFCLNDNNPSNSDHTYLFDNSMMPRPTVYMCEGMDALHSHIGSIFPYEAGNPTAHIGGDAFKNVNSNVWQNGLYGWDYQFSNATSLTTKNTEITEIKWFVIGNGDNINIVFENSNGNGLTYGGPNLTYRCFFFQTIFNGVEYTPVMNGYLNSLYTNYYQKPINYAVNTVFYQYYSYTFGSWGTNNPYSNNRVYKTLPNLVSNTVILKNTQNDNPRSVYLFPTMYSVGRHSGLSGDNFETYDREFCNFNIMIDNTSIKQGKINFFKFINNSVTSVNNGEIVRLLDNKNKDHLFFFLYDSFVNVTSSAGIDNGYNPHPSYVGFLTPKIAIDLLGKYDE